MTESLVRERETARFRAWVALLDACSANLDAFAAAEAEGWLPEDGWTVPSLSDVAHLGPLPPSLGPRAESLLIRTRECEVRAGTAMVDLRRRDRLTSRMKLSTETSGKGHHTGLLDNAG